MLPTIGFFTTLFGQLREEDGWEMSHKPPGGDTIKARVKKITAGIEGFRIEWNEGSEKGSFEAALDGFKFNGQSVTKVQPAFRLTSQLLSPLIVIVAFSFDDAAGVRQRVRFDCRVSALDMVMDVVT